MADKLKGCDIGQAWSILRGKIGSELLYDELIPVPYITEADLYDLMTVFYKHADKGLLAKLTKPRTYQMLGQFNSLANMSSCNRYELDMCSRPHIEELDFPAQYKCDLYGKAGREIHLSLTNPHKKVIILTGTHPGDLVLDLTADPVLESVDRVYLITEVVYVTAVHLVVTAGGCTKQYASSRLTPIAFSYQKFPLDYEGSIGTQLTSVGDMKKMSFVQLRQHRRPDDPLPEAPRTSISARWKPAARRNPRDGLPLLPAAGSDRGPPPPLPPDYD